MYSKSKIISHIFGIKEKIENLRVEEIFCSFQNSITAFHCLVYEFKSHFEALILAPIVRMPI